MKRFWYAPLLISTLTLGGCVVVPIPIVVGGTFGGDQQAAAPILRDDALRAALAGRTLSGQSQTIALAANGTTRVDLGWTQVSGQWSVTGDTLCLTTPIPGAASAPVCSRARVAGNQVTLTERGNGPRSTYTLL